MPVIIIEKMCKPDPDMYIIIAFIGNLLLVQTRKHTRLRGTNGDFPCLFDLQIILLLTSRGPLCGLFLLVNGANSSGPFGLVLGQRCTPADSEWKKTALSVCCQRSDETRAL